MPEVGEEKDTDEVDREKDTAKAKEEEDTVSERSQDASSSQAPMEMQSDFYECPKDFTQLIKDQFGIPSGEVDGLLWSKSPEPKPRKLWLMSRSVDRLLRSYSRRGLKVVSAGTPAFDRPSGAHSEPRVLVTALQWLTMTKRVYEVTPADFAKLLIIKVPAEAVGLGQVKESAIVVRCVVGEVSLRMPVYRGRHLAEGLVSEDIRPGLAWCVSKELDEDIEFPGVTLSAHSKVKKAQLPPAHDQGKKDEDALREGEQSIQAEESISSDPLLAGVLTASAVVAAAAVVVSLYRSIRKD